MSDDILNLNTDNFESTVLGSNKPVLVDFWAAWCGPCKSIAPILEELAGEMKASLQVCKVDVDNNTDIAGKFDIRAIPTMLLFKDGEVAETVVGLVSKDALKNRIQPHLS